MDSANLQNSHLDVVRALCHSRNIPLTFHSLRRASTSGDTIGLPTTPPVHTTVFITGCLHRYSYNREYSAQLTIAPAPYVCRSLSHTSQQQCHSEYIADSTCMNCCQAHLLVALQEITHQDQAAHSNVLCHANHIAACSTSQHTHNERATHTLHFISMDTWDSTIIPERHCKECNSTQRWNIHVKLKRMKSL